MFPHFLMQIMVIATMKVATTPSIKMAINSVRILVETILEVVISVVVEGEEMEEPAEEMVTEEVNQLWHNL